MVGIYPEFILLVVDTVYSWARMFVALFISMILALGIGIWTARSAVAGKIIIPVVDVLQTLPILAFFPFAIYIFVFYLPGYIGINSAVVFLIVTSMLWNMIFGVNEAVRTIPNEVIEMSRVYGMSLYKRLRMIFIPASLSKLSEQMSLSWAIGLFYLVTSEIFSTGNAKYEVRHGIGVALTQLGASRNFPAYLLGIGVFVLFVVVTRLLFFNKFDEYVNKYSTNVYPRHRHKLGLFDSLHMINFPKVDAGMSRLKGYMHSHRKLIFLALGILILALSIFLLLRLTINSQNMVSKVFYTIPGYEAESLFSLLLSFVRIWGAFLLILAISIPISVYVVFISKKKNTFLLLFQIAASIPATILLPILFIASGGNAEALAFMIFFLSGIWYVIFSILSRSKYLQSSIEDLQKIFQIRGINAWRYIYLKAIGPGLITGSITAIAAEWNASIIAEYFSSNGLSTSVKVGIGRLLDLSLSSGNIVLMLIALINMVIMIILLNTFLWKRLYSKVTAVYS